MQIKYVTFIIFEIYIFNIIMFQVELFWMFEFILERYFNRLELSTDNIRPVRVLDNNPLVIPFISFSLTHSKRSFQPPIS